MNITRAEFDALSSDSVATCPDCGTRTTTPRPGCRCPEKLRHGFGYFTTHIMREHHVCPKVEVPAEQPKEPTESAARAYASRKPWWHKIAGWFCLMTLLLLAHACTSPTSPSPTCPVLTDSTGIGGGLHDTSRHIINCEGK